jgi:hypothetical protein
MARNWPAFVGIAGLATIVGCYRPDPVAPQASVSPASPSGTASAPSLPAVPGPTAPTATTTATGSAATSSATPSSTAGTTGGAAAPRPTSTSSARVPFDRFTPPDRGLPPAMQTALATPSSRSPRSPRANSSGSRAPRTRVLAAPDSAGGVSGISFDDLMFDIAPDQKFEPSLLNDGVRSLFDRQVKIRGYILPQSVLFDKGNPAFILVRDNQECCFGPGAALYDCIYVQMKPGRTADFRAIPIAATGTFRFRPYQDASGATRAVFLLEADAIE